MTIIWVLLGIMMGCLCTALLLYRHFKKKIADEIRDCRNKCDLDLERKKAAIETECVRQLEQDRAEMRRTIENEQRQDYERTAALEQSKIDNLRSLQKTLLDEIENFRSTVEDRRKNIEENNKKSLENFELIIQNKKDEIQKNFNAFVENLAAEKEVLQNEIAGVRENLQYEKTTLLTAINDRIAISSGKEVGYSMHLSRNAIRELLELWDVINSLGVGNKAPLYKAVFEMYLRAPMRIMLNSVEEVGGGIYKITDNMTGRIYIGKTVNFTNRWTEHIKRGSFYEDGTAAGNGLYSAMKENGVWNFTFEVVEKIEEGGNLGEREKFWIGFYESDKNGLNLRRG